MRAIFSLIVFLVTPLLLYCRKVLGTNVHSTVRAQKNGVNEYPQPSARERGLFNFKETCPVRHTKQDDDAVLLFKGFCATKEQFESAEFKESLIPNSERFVERFVFPQDWYQDRVGFRLAASPNRAANYARILSESLVKSYLAVYEVKNASTLMRGEDFDSQWFDYLGIGEDVFLAACTTNVRLVGAYELFFPKEFF